MVANEEARKALNRSPCQRALDEEEKAFMRDTWEDVAEEDTPPSESRSQMKLSLGDLENDLLMKEIKRDEDDQDRNMFDSGDSVRPVRWLRGGGEGEGVCEGSMGEVCEVGSVGGGRGGEGDVKEEVEWNSVLPLRSLPLGACTPQC